MPAGRRIQNRLSGTSLSQRGQPANDRICCPERFSGVPIEVSDGLTPLHTIRECRLNFCPSSPCTSFEPGNISKVKVMYFSQLDEYCLQNDHWHEDCDMPLRAPPKRRSRAISGGSSAKRSTPWILAGFHDGICCKEVPRSHWAPLSAPVPHPRRIPPSASSTSDRETTTATTRPMRKAPRRSRRCPDSRSSRKKKSRKPTPSKKRWNR